MVKPWRGEIILSSSRPAALVLAAGVGAWGLVMMDDDFFFDKTHLYYLDDDW
jgi:hypothetical protein